MIPVIVLEKMIAWHSNGRRLVGIEWRPEINSVMAHWAVLPTLDGPVPIVHQTCYSISSIIGEK